MARNKQKKEQTTYYDYNLLAVIILLTCFGLVMLYSSSSFVAQRDYGNSFHYFQRQALFSIISFAGMFIVSLIDYRFWKKLAVLGYVGSIGLIFLVIPFGKNAKGATRWIQITDSIQIQPAEVAKLGIILFLAYLLCKMGKKINRVKGIMLVLVLGGLVSFLVLRITSNLSTAIIIAGITCIMIFVVHPKTWPFALAGLMASVGGYFGIKMISKVASDSNIYQLTRILVWLNPEDYASDGAYQVTQGLYAIGSGGFWGKGLGNSTQKLGWIPEAQNDFIFSVICEELGICGALIITLLFGFLLYRLVFIARNASDLFGSLLVIGVFAHISLQVIFNIAVVLGVIPTTGITLPFISYGGSSIMFLMAEMGLVLSVARKITFQTE